MKTSFDPQPVSSRTHAHVTPRCSWFPRRRACGMDCLQPRMLHQCQGPPAGTHSGSPAGGGAVGVCVCVDACMCLWVPALWRHPPAAVHMGGRATSLPCVGLGAARGPMPLPGLWCAGKIAGDGVLARPNGRCVYPGGVACRRVCARVCVMGLSSCRSVGWGAVQHMKWSQTAGGRGSCAGCVQSAALHSASCSGPCAPLKASKLPVCRGAVC